MRKPTALVVPEVSENAATLHTTLPLQQLGFGARPHDFICQWIRSSKDIARPAFILKTRWIPSGQLRTALSIFSGFLPGSRPSGLVSHVSNLPGVYVVCPLLYLPPCLQICPFLFFFRQLSDVPRRTPSRHAVSGALDAVHHLIA